MADATTTAHQLAFDVYGVRTLLSTNSTELFRRLEPVLPPGWSACPPEAVDLEVRALTDDGVFFDIAYDGEVRTAAADIDVALEVLDSQLRFQIAQRAPDRIFVHAGVVAHRDRAIVIPGASFSGKTTLVAELVRAGATYYSDEYAVLDSEGLVHPYAKPLSMRGADLLQTDHHVGAFGGTAGDAPIRMGLAIIAEYRPGAVWQPRRLTDGEAMLALLANTLPAQERPAQSLEAIRRAVPGAVALEGPRGEAHQIVEQLLESVPG
jgi:hypothetical protein